MSTAGSESSRLYKMSMRNQEMCKALVYVAGELINQALEDPRKILAGLQVTPLVSSESLH